MLDISAFNIFTLPFRKIIPIYTSNNSLTAQVTEWVVMLLIELNYIRGKSSLWEENTGFRLGYGNWIIFINSLDIHIPLDYLCDNDSNTKTNNSWHPSHWVLSPLHLILTTLLLVKLPPFYRRENWSLEHLSYLTKITGLVSSTTGIQINTQVFLTNTS